LALVVAAVIARLVRLPVPVPAFALTIHGRRHIVRVANHYELAGAVEVLTAGDYDDVPLEAGEVRRVLDLGANVGFATLLFASRYPLAEIVAVEPAPDTFERLRINAGALVNVTLAQLAVGAPGLVKLDLSVPSTERHGGSGAGETVARVGLQDLLMQLDWPSVDVLKVDIEGDEYALFEQEAVGRARFIVGELHTGSAPAGSGELPSLLPGFDVRVGHEHGGCAMFTACRRSDAA
jgi:FkbM family methyltransferase